MKMGLKILLGFGIAVIAMQANALSITASSCPADAGSGGTYYTDSDGTDWMCWTAEGLYQEPIGNSGKTRDIVNPDAADVFAITGVEVELYYKNDVDTGETATTGGFERHYDTEFTPTTDPMQAIISHIGGSSIACPECFVLVKDGNTSPTWYLFDIGYWNGTDPLELLNFWPGNGSISHVSIFGAPGQIPEPAPLALLAIALVGLGVHSLRKKVR